MTAVATLGKGSMHAVKYVHWQEGDSWLGSLEE
jgi:hypothetical protein